MAGSDSLATDGRLRSGGTPLSERVRSLRLPNATGESKKSSRLPWTLAIIFFLTTILFGAEAMAPADVEPGDGPPAANSGVADKGNSAVTVLQARSAESEKSDIALESKGYIIPHRLVQVSPKVGGMAVEVYIDENQWVEKDQVLAEIEDTEYLAEYNRVAALVSAAKARWQELYLYRDVEIRQAEAEYEDARSTREQLFAEWKRNLNLKGTSAVSPRDFEQIESNYRSQNAKMQRLALALDLLKKGPRDERIAAAKAEFEQATAELVRAKWKLDSCKVRAPLAGHIISKKAEKGNMINPSAFSNGVSASLCEMANLGELEVDLSIAERDIGKVFVGQKCKVRPEAFADRVYEGFVDRIMPMADRAKSSVPVRVTIVIPKGEEGKFLRPDMGAVVTFYRASTPNKSEATKTETANQGDVRIAAQPAVAAPSPATTSKKKSNEQR